ncbi:MAG TPA: lytic transglycosylase domain-containing protein [Pyrinomonadaceae bacterium]
MKTPRYLILTFGPSVLALLVSGSAFGQRDLEHAPAATANETSHAVRLKMADGSFIVADEASESEQGIWYRQGGMNHLVERTRVKTIDRDAGARTRQEPQVAKVVVADNASKSDSSASSIDQPVWIYLVGGARVEADNVTESAAGAWYRRGPLSVFVERARIDHIEREVETLAESNSSSKKARGWTTGSGKIDSLIKQSGTKYGVDPYLIFCVMEQESHFNARALSPKGARGLMQLMPGTSARFGVRRPSDPAQNIAGGTRYLKQLLQRFDGRIDLVLASYNAGEGAVLKFGRKVPPYRETRNYVKRISFRYRQPKPTAPAKSEVATVGAAL